MTPEELVRAAREYVAAWDWINTPLPKHVVLMENLANALEGSFHHLDLPSTRSPEE